jgi:starch phosphorylase
VLAGDTVHSAADLRLSLVAVSVVSRAGHFRREMEPVSGQVERPAVWEPREWMRALDAKIALSPEGRVVWIGAWLYVLQGQLGGRAPVILLDTDLDENAQEDRGITHYLYGGDERYRLKQEAMLGFGGVRMLQALGFRIRQYHMDEGHSAMLGLELLRRYAYAPDDVQPGEAPTIFPACGRSAVLPPTRRRRPDMTDSLIHWCSERSGTQWI